MTINCDEKIRKFKNNANKNDLEKIEILLKIKKIENIRELAISIGSTISSTSRLIHRLGFDYFKRFKAEYNNEKEKNMKISIKSLKEKGIAILCSRRTKLTGELLDITLSNSYDIVLYKYDGVKKFLEDNKSRIIILVSFTGESLILSNSLKEISK